MNFQQQIKMMVQKMDHHQKQRKGKTRDNSTTYYKNNESQ